MKKVTSGIIIGFMLSLPTVMYASDNISANLFPAQIVMNGEKKTIPTDTPVLIYNDSAYVPIRYITENMGAVVGYDRNSNTISIDYFATKGSVILSDSEGLYPEISIGNLSVAKENGQTKVTGMFHNAAFPYSDNRPSILAAVLTFLGADSKVLGKVTVHVDNLNDKGFASFETTVPEDIPLITMLK